MRFQSTRTTRSCLCGQRRDRHTVPAVVETQPLGGSRSKVLCGQVDLPWAFYTKIKEGPMLTWSWLVLSAASVNSLIPWLHPIAVVTCGVAIWTALLFITWFLIRTLRGMRRQQHLLRCARCHHLFSGRYNCYLLEETISSHVTSTRPIYRVYRRRNISSPSAQRAIATNPFMRSANRK